MNVSHWYLYLIRTRNGSLYTGITTDISRRFMQHTSGKGAKALRGKGPLTIVYQSSVKDRGIALRMEYCVKKLSKQQKEKLVITQPLCITTYLMTTDLSEKCLPEITPSTITYSQNGQNK
ncbi:GIY-YIG nuclease family protein [Xenorhabdus hominickii]|uniref:GIY-YIG nuclease family protein n=1 Tax=Xenorhabdus hominickii TaxID=351679 RepID=UPI000A01A4FC